MVLKAETCFLTFCSHIIDDKAAKKCAEIYNISISGTIAIIIKAKKMGLTSKVEPLLRVLRSNGFRVSDNIIMAALRIAEEDRCP